jgi:hypothetical protein
VSPNQHPDAVELLDAVIERIAQRVAESVADKLLDLQPKSPTQEARYLNERAVAGHIGISMKTLEGWRYLGHGPPYQRAGRKVLYEITALQEWLAGGGKAGPNARVPAHATTSRRVRRDVAQETTRGT